MIQQRTAEIELLGCGRLGTQLLLLICCSPWVSYFTSLGLGSFFGKILILVNIYQVLTLHQVLLYAPYVYFSP